MGRLNGTNDRPALTPLALAALVIAVGSLPAVAADDEQAAAAAAQFFEAKIRPVLAERCYGCHSKDVDEPESGLRLDSLAHILRGGARGPALVPEKPDESRLLAAIQYTDSEVRMPPDRKLDKETIADFERWIAMGAPWPGADVDEAEPAEPAVPRSGITDVDRAYWAFQPVKRPDLPSVRNEVWGAHPIDRFVLHNLEAAGLTPNPRATKRELVRRAYFDLIGLPPTPEEVAAFVADESPKAWERLIDDLLARPQYGEKWGRHWLDLVRYAETNGYERDGTKPNAWRYRDYVIDSFNADRPFDRFIVEQLAGDELPDRSRDSIIATGYYRLGLWQDEPVDFEQNYYDQLDDVVRTTAEAFLGTTVGCARCHDHKADPIPQTDYYRFLAFFHDIEPYSKTRDVTSPFNQTEITPDDVRRQIEALDREIVAVNAKIEPLEQVGLAKLDAARRAELEKQKGDALKNAAREQLSTDEQKQLADFEAQRASLNERKNALPREFALSVNNCLANPPVTHVLLRGSAAAKGAEVAPGFPEVLGVPDPQFVSASDENSAGRRLALATWIASPENPLTGRVIANRLFQHHFGRGIVATPNDFGLLGMPPTHPELLDWLAAEFIDGGWSIKAMHRLIMTSNAYQMSSAPNPQALAQDPANDLFWRYNMRRLTAEEFRDAILAVNGKLNLQMGGPSIYTEVPAAVLQTSSTPDQAWGKSPPDQQTRRSVYIFIKRSLVEPVLSAFDYPDTDASAASRFVTTVPTQALTSLNGGFFNAESAALAERLRREAGSDPAAQITRAFDLALGRAPEPAELQRGLELLKGWQTEDGLSSEQALQAFCLVVYNMNEFVYVD